MVVQYPHSLIVSSLVADAVQNSDGNWEQEDNEQTVVGDCRAERNTYRTITGVDGTAVLFSWTVYLPLSTSDINQGAQVQIRDISVASYNNAIVSGVQPLEIDITSDVAGGSAVPVEALEGKQFRLERRGLGPLKESEFSYLSGGGFQLTDPDEEVKEGETFFAYFTTVNQLPSSDVLAARLIAQGTVIQFVRGQLNCRLWL